MRMHQPKLSLLVLAAIALNAVANAPPTQPVRTLFEHHDQSDVPGKEIVIGTAMVPARTAIGYHTHPGDEIGYVIKGNLILKTRGQPDRALKAGDTFFNPRGAMHSLAAAPGGEGGTEVSTWIVDKGQPLATMIP
jgi:quercetin dioxygenase-like cupin family protein